MLSLRGLEVQGVTLCILVPTNMIYPLYYCVTVDVYYSQALPHLFGILCASVRTSVSREGMFMIQGIQGSCKSGHKINKQTAHYVHSQQNVMWSSSHFLLNLKT